MKEKATMKKKKILGVNFYGSSGFAQSTRLNLAHLHDLGHEVWLIGNLYDGNIKAVDRSPTMYPYAERIIPGKIEGELPEAVAKIQPDIVLTGFDMMSLKALLDPEKGFPKNGAVHCLLGQDTRHFTHIAYFPLESLIEGGYMSRECEQLLGLIDVPVCYSRYGQQGILRSCGLDIPFIPLPIDTTKFFPRGRALARRQIPFPANGFVVGMIATNQWRKLWNEFLEVMGRVINQHPDVYMLPWWIQGNGPGGFNLPELLYRNNLHRNVIMPPGNLNEEQMGLMYSALDLVVLTSACEGAGLPPIQARASGTPALVSNNTGMTEFAGHPFELIPSESAGLVHGFIPPFNTVVYTTNTDVLEERIEKLYADRALRDEIAAASLKAMEAYYPEKILPLWEKLIDGIS
jgi:glycosyltransferase involved in cell wall biosynthesis